MVDFFGGVGQFGNALQNLGNQIQANSDPAYAEIMTKQRKMDALRQLAGQLQGNISPEQRQSALQKYAEITGDLDPLLGIGGQALPASLQIANELKKAREAGDIQRVRDLEGLNKVHDKGVVIDPISGQPIALPGYAEALGALGYGRKTGETQGVKDVEIVMNPKIAEQEALAKISADQTGQAQEKASSGKGTLDLVREAREILPNASSGRIEAAYTGAQGLFGKSTPESQADARLAVIAAGLTQNVPRMEGPQSDRDVQMYKEAAAQVANSSVPVEDRMAALQTLEDLNKKYENQNTGNLRPQGVAPSVDAKRARLEELRRKKAGQ